MKIKNVALGSAGAIMIAAAATAVTGFTVEPVHAGPAPVCVIAVPGGVAPCPPKVLMTGGDPATEPGSPKPLETVTETETVVVGVGETATETVTAEPTKPAETEAPSED